MKVVKTIKEVKEIIKTYKGKQKTIGFVPTMGALHPGHVSLIQKAKESTDKVICSIFVNPIQFNDPADLEKYPRTLEADLHKLEEAGCDVVFVPDVKEMYPEEVKEQYVFDGIENRLEGEFRPGHFNGVAVVVKRLFEIVEPDKAFFGEKDFQQWVIICKLVEKYKIPVQIIACPIMRETDGLAMSSRNIRLSVEDRKSAPFIYQTLSQAKGVKETDAGVIKDLMIRRFHEKPEFNIEYIEIIDDRYLLPVEHLSDSKGVVACIAVWLGGVRLIDMIRFV